MFLHDLIVNESSVQLDSNESELLNKGLYFAIPLKNVPTIDLIVDVEIALNLPFGERNHTRHLVKKTLSKEMNIHRPATNKPCLII